MIKAEIKYKLNFPKLNFQEDLENIAKNIIIPDMQHRIQQHKAIDGGALPENEPSTIKKKGHGKQLQDTGTLLKNFIYNRAGKDTVKITVGPERHEIGLYLEAGIKSDIGIKTYRFFGISIFASRKAMGYMKKRIAEMCKNA